jgi:ATP-dependent DNA helicase DinG
VRRLQRIFAADGPLAGTIPGFMPRTVQIEMALTVEEAIEHRRCLIAEAGTGTGKTIAYLVPAILSGKQTVISSATKHLQDQLFNKDLPAVRRALAIPFKAALLKGRANYLCLYRLETALGFLPHHGHTEAAGIERIRGWARHTLTGDIAEVNDVAETSPLWPAVTSTADNCLGQECPQYAGCFLAKARRVAQEADILIINHHLLCADWALKNDGFGEVLPDAEVIIVDEAHQFAETALQFLGTSLSSRQLRGLASDILSEQARDAADMPDLARATEALGAEIDALRSGFPQGAERGAWQQLERSPALMGGLERLAGSLKALAEMLQRAAIRGKGLESCGKRCEDAEARLRSLRDDGERESIRWFETYKRGFSLNRTPLEIAREFRQFMKQSRAAWIFTSATLSVGASFDHFNAMLGLDDVVTKIWNSPFDYRRQCLLYLPPDLPDPGSSAFTEAVAHAALPVLNASQGRAFFLFTSHQALQRAAAVLARETSYPLYVQGSAPKQRLLEAFKRAGNGILLGTASFWEGVDVRGPALSCVIIDRLPFAAPSEPVLAARLEALRRKGADPFTCFQLPSAVIALKQGMGRLIRDSRDRGVLMLCDPRIRTKSYGKWFLASLPDMPLTRAIEDVERFFAAEPVEAAQ